MKKLIALLLVAVMALGMAACSNAGADNNENNDNNTTTEAKVEAPASALEVLENTWALYNEETEKFFCFGGSINEEGMPAAENAPGAVDLSQTDYLSYTLLVPEAQVAGVTEAASLMHGMNANTFTCGAYKVSDVDAFVPAMQTAIQNNQWMCGFPETLLIANVGGVIVVAFGNGEVMSVFQGHLTTAYTGAQILVNEAIGG